MTEELNKFIKYHRDLVYMITEKASGISIPEDVEYEIKNSIYNIECEIKKL